MAPRKKINGPVSKTYKNQMNRLVSGLKDNAEEGKAKMSSFLADLLNQINSTSLLSDLAEDSFTFICEEFFPNAIAAVLQTLPPPDIFRFFNQFISFVAYSISRNYIRAFSHINMFIENQDAMNKFANCAKKEFDIYFENKQTNYMLCPALCAFSVPMSDCVSLQALIIQSMGQKNIFPILFDTIEACASFQDVQDIISFFLKTEKFFNPEYKDYIAKVISRRFEPETDKKFQDSHCLTLLRMMYLFSSIGSPRKAEIKKMYFSILLNNFVDSILGQNEFLFICKNEKLEDGDTVLFLQKILEKSLSYSQYSNEAVIAAIVCLNSKNALQHEHVYSLIRSNFYVLSNTFQVFEPVIDFLQLFDIVVSGEQSSDKADLMAKILTHIKSPDKNSLQNMIKTSDRLLFDNIVKASEMENLRPSFISCIKDIIDNHGTLKESNVELLCKLVKSLGGEYNYENLSSIVFECCQGDSYINIVNEFSFIKIGNPPAVFEKCKDSELIFDFLQSKMQNYVLEYFDLFSKTFTMTPRLVKIVLFAFFNINEIKNRTCNDCSTVQFRTVIWKLFLIAQTIPDLYTFASEMLMLINQFIYNAPNETAKDLLEMTQQSCCQDVIRQLLLLDQALLKLIPIAPFYEAINTNPFALSILHILPTLRPCIFTNDCIKRVIEGNEIVSLQIIDCANKMNSSQFITKIQPHTQRLYELVCKDYQSEIIACTARSIILRTFSRMRVYLDGNFLTSTLTMAIKNGFLGLASQCIEQMSYLEIQLDQATLISNFSKAPLSYDFSSPSAFSSLTSRLLLRRYRNISSFEIVLNACNGKNISEMVENLIEFEECQTDTFLSKIFNKITRIIDEINPDSLTKIIKALPFAQNVSKALLSFIFDSGLPPFLRSPAVIQGVLYYFRKDCSELIKFLEPINPPQISFIRPNIITNDSTKHKALPLSLHILASYNLLLYQFVTRPYASLNPIEEIILRTAFSNEKSIDIKSIEKQIPFGYDCDNIDQFESTIMSLQPEQKLLFGAEVFDEQSGQTRKMLHITVESTRMQNSGLDSFFENPFSKQKQYFNKAPNCLIVRTICPGSGDIDYFNENPAKFPLEIDVTQNLLSKQDGVMELHAFVTNSQEHGVSAFISDNGGYLECWDKGIGFVHSIPLKYIPEFVVYKRKSVNPSSMNVWRNVQEEMRNKITLKESSVMKALHVQNIPWFHFDINEKYFALAKIIFVKFHSNEVIQRLDDNSEFSAYLFSDPQEIMKNGQLFQNNKELLGKLARKHPNQQKLYSTLLNCLSVPGCKEPTITLNLFIRPGAENVNEFLFSKVQDSLAFVAKSPQFPLYSLSCFSSSSPKELLTKLIKHPVLSPPLFSTNDDRLLDFIIPVDLPVFEVILRSSHPHFVFRVVSIMKEPILIIRAASILSLTHESVSLINGLELSEAFRKNKTWVKTLLLSPLADVCEAACNYVQKLWTIRNVDEEVCDILSDIVTKSQSEFQVSNVLRLMLIYLDVFEDTTSFNIAFQITIRSSRDRDAIKSAIEQSKCSEKKKAVLYKYISKIESDLNL